MRIRRNDSGPGPHLEWRVRLLGGGAILALAGIWADLPWLINGAIAMLLIGFALRFIGGDGDEAPDADEDGPWDGGHHRGT
ncbi:MAG: hypothetical protein P8188_01975 [Gemmatimonadota bacterium]